MAFKLAEAFVELTTRDRNLDAGLVQSRKKVDRASTAMMASLGRIGATVGAGLFLKGAVTAASDAAESLNRFNAVMGTSGTQASKFVDQLNQSLGRNRTATRDALSSFQGFSIGLGASSKEAFKMSRELTQLSLDFASFNNLSDAEAQQRFISAMSGSAEVLDKFGVNLRAANIEIKLAEMGLDKTASEATELEKGVARLAIIREVMGKQGAIGDAVRTSGEFAGSMKRLKDEMKTFQETLGNQVLPPLSEMLTTVNNLVGAINDLNESMESGGRKGRDFGKLTKELLSSPSPGVPQFPQGFDIQTGGEMANRLKLDRMQRDANSKRAERIKEAARIASEAIGDKVTSAPTQEETNAERQRRIKHHFDWLQEQGQKIIDERERKEKEAEDRERQRKEHRLRWLVEQGEKLIAKREAREKELEEAEQERIERRRRIRGQQGIVSDAASIINTIQQRMIDRQADIEKRNAEANKRTAEATTRIAEHLTGGPAPPGYELTGTANR